MTSIGPTTSNGFRRRLPAALIAAAAALGGIGIGDAAIAHAEPREWDVIGTDNCRAYAEELYKEGKITVQKYEEYVVNCCTAFGGIWSNTQGCVAPPANATHSPRTLPSRVPTQTFEADPPPSAQQPGNVGNVTQTFEPVSVG